MKTSTILVATAICLTTPANAAHKQTMEQSINAMQGCFAAAMLPNAQALHVSTKDLFITFLIAKCNNEINDLKLVLGDKLAFAAAKMDIDTKYDMITDTKYDTIINSKGGK